MLAEVRRIYRQSLKPADSRFNLYLARPVAAAVVAVLARTRVTPNQVTLFSIAVILPGLVALALLPGAWGLVLGVLGVELAYILDCADGQLARLTGRTSPVGSELDFLMDELKAYLLVVGLTARWVLQDGGGTYALFVGLFSLAIIGGALSLTRFVRTPEYAEATGTKRVRHGQSVAEARTRGGMVGLALMALRFISQYPVSLPIFAAVDRLDIFLYAYGGVHLLYVGRTVLVIGLRLGRFAPRDEGSR